MDFPNFKLLLEPTILGSCLFFGIKHLTGFHGHYAENTVLADLFITLSLTYIIDVLAAEIEKKLPTYSIHWALNYMLKMMFAFLMIHSVLELIWLPFERLMTRFSIYMLNSVSEDASACPHVACMLLKKLTHGLQHSLFWDFLSGIVASVIFVICRLAANPQK